MNYTILIYENAADFAARTDDKRKDAYWGAYRAYTKALTDAGVMIGGAGLQPPPPATTVRQRTASGRCRTGRTPRPRSSSAATTSSTCPTSTRARLGVALSGGVDRRGRGPAQPLM